jgi:hypothetical protein
MLSKNFHSFLKEAQFTFEILASGVTKLGKVNYAKKGMYFTSFTSISTGLERIGKICLILDYSIRNNGDFPSAKSLKYGIGHGLQELYNKSKEIITHYNFSLNHLQDLQDPIYIEILSILSNFDKGDRYSNIDFLVNNNSQNDPIKDWHIKIDQVLFEKRVSKAKKDRIIFNSELAGRILGGHSIVRHLSETGLELNDIETSSYQTGVSSAVAKYRQLYMLHIIRYWVDLLREPQSEADMKNLDILHFTEIFAIFYNEDNYLITRKTFERL